MDLATKDLRKFGKKFLFWFGLLTLIMSLVILLVITKSGLSFFSISGNSMHPTLDNGDSIILKQSNTMKQNQIIFFNKPDKWSEYADMKTTMVKRVAAIPGDTLTFDGDSFKVNGILFYQLSKDDYECEAGEQDYEHMLTQDEVFVTGDNANHSLDSRRIFCDGQSSNMFITKKSIVDYGSIVRVF